MKEVEGVPENVARGRRYKFFLLLGFFIGLRAAYSHYGGDLDAIRRNAAKIELDDYSHIDRDDPENVVLN